jgi:dipeptidase E
MKLLLTSGGITNDTLARELEALVGKPFNELSIGFIPSAAFGDPSDDKWWLIDDMYRLKNRGARVAIVSLADCAPEEIAAQLEAVDVIFVGGGQTFYLSWLMQQKGLFELLPKLLESKVYAGISAGSMIMTPKLATVSFAIRKPGISDEELEELGPEGRSLAKTLGLVDFMLRPHMNGEAKFRDITPEMVQNVVDAAQIPAYMLDDQSAIRVIDDEVTVVGEGQWRLVEPIRNESVS